MGSDLAHGLIRKIEQSIFDAVDIPKRALDQKIYITGCTDISAEDDRKTANNDVFDACFVEMPAKQNQII
jgi:hypothetical protein